MVTRAFNVHRHISKGPFFLFGLRFRSNYHSRKHASLRPFTSSIARGPYDWGSWGSRGILGSPRGYAWGPRYQIWEIVIPRRFYTKCCTPCTVCNSWFGMESAGYYDLPKFDILGPLDALIPKIYLIGWDFCFLRVTSFLTARFHLGTITNIRAQKYPSFWIHDYHARPNP